MDMFERMMAPSTTSASVPLQPLLLALLVAFLIGQLSAWFYKWTYRGVSYQRGLTHTIILIAVIAALSMHLVSHSIIAVFGLLGGMAIVRFRTPLRDPRDSAYLLMALVCGMAAGFGFHALALAGGLFINLVAWYLQASGFGGMYALDSLLRFRVEAARLSTPAIADVLKGYCRTHTVIAVDEVPGAEAHDGAVAQCTYKLRLRDPREGADLVAALKQRCDAESVQLLVEPGEEE